MSRVFMVSLGFAPIRVISECFHQVYSSIGDVKFEHLLLNNHYPVHQEINDKLVKTLCDHYGIKFFDVNENTGLAAGYNFLLKQIDLRDNDIVIGVDPDVLPITQGWGEALVKVLSAPGNAGWVSLYNQHTPREFAERGFTELTIAGVRCHKANQAMLNSVCAWKGKMLKAMEGLHEPRKYYGGFESMSFPIIKNLGFEWVFLPDFIEEHTDAVAADPCYRHYKWEYAHIGSTALSFADWLKESPDRLKLK